MSQLYWFLLLKMILKSRLRLKENHYKKISSYSTKLSLLFVLDTLYTAYLGDIMKRILKRRQSTIIKMTGE